MRTLNDLDQLKEFIDTRHVKNAVVIGAGFIGIEVAENLVHRGIVTVVVEKSNQLMPILDAEVASYLEQEMRSNGINLHFGVGAKKIENPEFQWGRKTGRKIRTFGTPCVGNPLRKWHFHDSADEL